jgi:hypothetical protein
MCTLLMNYWVTCYLSVIKGPFSYKCSYASYSEMCTLKDGLIEHNTIFAHFFIISITSAPFPLQIFNI